MCAKALLPVRFAARRWESSGYFKPDESAPGQPYVISMPPPNVTGKLHMGHAMFATLQVRAGRGGPPHASLDNTARTSQPASRSSPPRRMQGRSERLAPTAAVRPLLHCDPPGSCPSGPLPPLQDIMTRYQRMRGRPTLWLPGTGKHRRAQPLRVLLLRPLLLVCQRPLPPKASLMAGSQPARTPTSMFPGVA